MAKAAPAGGVALPGMAEMQAVVQLAPVKYQIALYYMGHDRIKHEKKKYRCKYKLERGAVPILLGPDLIPNCVKVAHVDAASEEAATPYNKEGSNKNPANDELYRVMILDNHAMRSGEDLLGDPGDKISKVKNYKSTMSAGTANASNQKLQAEVTRAQNGLNAAIAAGQANVPDFEAWVNRAKAAQIASKLEAKEDWQPDISPAIPFRVVIKKFVGAAQVDVKEKLNVVVEVKDPAEEMDVLNAADDVKRRLFIRGFFGKYNRPDKNPTEGDDNAPKAFGGVRAPSASHKGVKATDVLKKVKYVNKPPSDVGPSIADCVEFSDLSSASSYGSARAKFKLEEVTEGGFKVGVADFAFCPPPVGGDNYRFLLTLRDSSDKDVRTLKVNNVPVQLVDSTNDRIFAERAYTTGRFVIWKKVEFKLLVLCNGLTVNDITWATIQGSYRRAFMEVVPPLRTANVTRTAWRDMLRAHFDPAGTDPIFNVPANFDNAMFNLEFCPPALQSRVGTDGLTRNFNSGGDLEPMALQFIDAACAAAAPPIVSPRNNLKQEDSDGLFVFYCRKGTANVSGVGAYFADRTFWFFEQGNIAATTSTCAHELGHAMYLRHSHTARMNLQLQTTTGLVLGPLIPITVSDGESNNNLRDHDQNDAFACLMSYTRASSASPCGLCCLTLRMFDRIEITKESKYGKQCMSGLGPAIIVEYLPGAPDTASDVISNVAVGATIQLMCLGPQTAFTDRGGNARQGRINLSDGQKKDPVKLWSKSGPGRVDISVVKVDTDNGVLAHLLVTGRGAGNVNIKWSNAGVTATSNFLVV